MTLSFQSNEGANGKKLPVLIIEKKNSFEITVSYYLMCCRHDITAAIGNRGLYRNNYGTHAIDDKKIGKILHTR